jgi:hypothetical protein
VESVTFSSAPLFQMFLTDVTIQSTNQNTTNDAPAPSPPPLFLLDTPFVFPVIPSFFHSFIVFRLIFLFLGCTPLLGHEFVWVFSSFLFLRHVALFSIPFFFLSVRPTLVYHHYATDSF